MDLQQGGARRRRGIGPLAARFCDDDVGGVAPRTRRHARRRRLQRIGDREDAVDADRAVEHRVAHTRERRAERLAGRLGHGGTHGGRRPHQPRGRLRPHPGEGLNELDRVAASEVRRHPLVAHRVRGPPRHLADRIDEERLGEPGEARDRGHLRCELGLRCALHSPRRCRLADQHRDLRVQVVEPVREEVHTPHSDRGVGHGTG